MMGFWERWLPLWVPKWEARIRRAMRRRAIEPPADLTAHVERLVQCDEDPLGSPLRMRYPERFRKD